MSESFLHYVWQLQYFDKLDLRSTEGEPVTVFHPGFLNTDAGPDFFNARIQIGSMQWVGNIEIHISASAWNEHRHDQDEAYDNVVLHVVWNDDKPVMRSDGSLMPTLIIKNRVPETLILSYRELLNTERPIACASLWHQVEHVWKIDMVERSLVKRLEAKAEKILDLYGKRGNDWEETCYQVIGENFGFNVNAVPFQQLVQRLPYKVLQKHGDKRYQLEALLFGQAGFLEQFLPDEYFLLLKREYSVLRKKYQLEGSRLSPANWKFLRLRPANFPTLRIAQFAALICSRKSIFSCIIENPTKSYLSEMFSVQQSEYWRRHYRFGEDKEEMVNPPGEMTVASLIINSAVPLLAAYGRLRGETEWMEKCINILQSLPAETNSVTKKYTSLGMTIKNAFDSQAIIELYRHFCQPKKCLDCSIGNRILKPVMTT